MKTRTEGREEGGRREKAREAFAGASALQGPSGPAPTQPLYIQAMVHHSSACIFPGAGCSLLSRLPVPAADSLTFGKVFRALT